MSSKAVTPAMAMGIIENVTRLKRWEDDNYVWLLSDDDGTTCPFFKSECGSETDRVFTLSSLTIIETALLRMLPPTPPTGFEVGAKPAVESKAQRQALATFKTMRGRAQQILNGENVSEELFYTGYGICDNISRCRPSDANTEQMAMIKDNLIRRVPSYSGNYHYPVSCPNNPGVDGADSAWSNNSNKWTGGYGKNRLTQLEELIYAIQNNWDEKLTEEMTPATRVGLIQGVSIVTRKSDKSLWTFTHDDRSSDPYFEPVGGGDRRSIDLRHIEIMPLADFTNEQRSVAEFLAEIATKQKEQEAIQAQIAALQKTLQKATTEVTLLDYGLRTVHKVQRLDK